MVLLLFNYRKCYYISFFGINWNFINEDINKAIKTKTELFNYLKKILKQLWFKSSKKQEYENENERIEFDKKLFVKKVLTEFFFKSNKKNDILNFSFINNDNKTKYFKIIKNWDNYSIMQNVWMWNYQYVSYWIDKEKEQKYWNWSSLKYQLYYHLIANGFKSFKDF